MGLQIMLLAVIHVEVWNYIGIKEFLLLSQVNICQCPKVHPVFYYLFNDSFAFNHYPDDTKKKYVCTKKSR